jgi:hypothetical protein
MASGALLIAIALAYVFAVERWVLLERPVPFSYRHFLLQSSAGVTGKIVFDSGSNGLHGIDAQALSQRLGLPVVIASDAAGNPLRMKYFRLRSALAPGDILILPLEWDYYSQSEHLPDSFVGHVADEQLRKSHYISDLPPLEKARFITTEYPLGVAVESFFTDREPGAIKADSQAKLDRFLWHFSQNNNLFHGGTERDGPEEINPLVTLSDSCDSYLFERDDTWRLEVSDTFRDDLELLKGIRDAGVRVFFAWPAVVDEEENPCYVKEPVSSRLNAYAEEITQELNDHGFPMLGHYRDNHYPAECFLNTYYHLRYSCADQRTDDLAGMLLEAGVGGQGRVYDYEAFAGHLKHWGAAYRRALIEQGAL